MAILDYEHWNRESDLSLSNWFNPYNGSVSADGQGPFGYGRYHSPMYSSPGTGRYNSFANKSRVMWQEHVYTLAGSNGVLFCLFDGSKAQIYFKIDQVTRKLQAKRGDLDFGTLLGESAQAISTETWHFFQFDVTISPSAGVVKVKMDNSSSLMLDLSGQNTQNGTNPWVNGWTVGGYQFYHANLIIFDDIGAAPTAWTPETRIYADLPNGAGASSGWTPSAGSNYQNVDEQPNDGDTTYNSTTTVGAEDTYACPASVPAGCAVYAVAVEADVRKDDAGTNDADALLRSGGVNYASGSPLSLTTQYQRLTRIWKTDPATGAQWTVANANASQPGVKRTA